MDSFTHRGRFGRYTPKQSRDAVPTPDPSPKSPRQKIALIKVSIRNTWRSILRVFALVWSTSRSLTVGLGSVTLLQSVIPALQVWLAGRLIDEVATGIEQGLGDDHLRPVAVLVGLQLGLFLASSLFQTVGNICQQLLQERLAIHVQLTIMEHANSLDLADFENSHYYDQLQQAQREAANRPIRMVEGVFGLVRSAITFGTLIALLINLSPWVAVLALLSPIPAFISGTRYGWWGFLQMRRQSPARRRMGYLSTLLTTDTFNKEIKLYTLGDHFIDRYRETADGYYADTKQLLLRRYVSGFLWGSLTIVTAVGTFLYVARLALRGSISIGSVAVYAQTVQQLQGAFQGLLGGLQGIYEHGLYLTTLYDLLDREPKIDAPEEPAPVQRPFTRGIEFRNVTFRYPDRSEPALDNVSFTIDLDETIALVGRNGAGKSTIVKLLGRLYDPSEGQILVDGRDIREYDPIEYRQQIGMMFQDYVMYQLSAGENIGVGSVERVQDTGAIADAAERSGADALIAKLPEGYETNLGKWFADAQQMSGGEWQKVALARAFMRDAQILILDEPTSALDAEAEHELFRRIQNLTVGKMAVFISHRFSTTRSADRVLVLEDGRIIEDGTHDELMLRGGDYSDLFELQAASYR